MGGWLNRLPFRRVWLADFEFTTRPGERPSPICLVARELRSGCTHRWSGSDLSASTSPFCEPDAVFCAYYASADIGCCIALGWSPPLNVIDLFAEFRVMTNGKSLVCGRGLAGALAYFGLTGIEHVEKDSMRQLAMRGGPYNATERAALLDYCESDVCALDCLLDAMGDRLDVERAILRGRYAVAAARIEHLGVPIDVPRLAELRGRWGLIREALVQEIDRDFGVYEGTTFKASRFQRWLSAQGARWPRREDGGLLLDRGTFREMARIHPSVAPLAELRQSLSQLRLADLAVGCDGRNRCILSAFAARTGRNQPSTSRFIFGPARWIRGLIRPDTGRSLAYIDWEQQEFGIAAALAGDVAMLAAYASGDPYLAFARQAGAVVQDATRETHAAERERFKACVLAVQYGMGATSLAERVGCDREEAESLLRAHRRTYPRFWAWSDGAVDFATAFGSIHTVFGWRLHVGDDPNVRSIRNFPMQANGAEMLRLACCFATEAGVSVCAPVHDALLIEADTDSIQRAVAATRAAMKRASEIVLAGVALRTDVRVVAHPGRYGDSRGQAMWSRVMRILEDRRRDELLHERNFVVAQARTRSFS